jgi:hypothetical protein
MVVHSQRSWDYDFLDLPVEEFKKYVDELIK